MALSPAMRFSYSCARQAAAPRFRVKKDNLGPRIHQEVFSDSLHMMQQRHLVIVLPHNTILDAAFPMPLLLTARKMQERVPVMLKAAASG